MADTLYTVFKTKELKDSTFRTRIVDFVDHDISEADFEFLFTGNFSTAKIQGEVQRTGNVLFLPFTAVENKTGLWKVELWMTENGFRDKVLQWDLDITEKVGELDVIEPITATVTHNEQTYEVSITQGIVEIRLAFEDLTPEQKAELVGPQGPKGDTSILEFEIDDNMNLIQYSEGGDDLDFSITEEGELTLTF